MCVWLEVKFCHLLNYNPLILFVAASFSIPETLMVIESNPVLVVCITMATNPPEAVLAKQVDLTISTTSGIGKS